MVNGYSIVTYQRPLKASDELDHPILTNRSQAIIWAIGPLNERQEVSFHSRYLKTDRFIEFGRPPAWNCPMPDQEQISAPGGKGSGTQVSCCNINVIRECCILYFLWKMICWTSRRLPVREDRHVYQRLLHRHLRKTLGRYHLFSAMSRMMVFFMHKWGPLEENTAIQPLLVTD